VLEVVPLVFQRTLQLRAMTNQDEHNIKVKLAKARKAA
jgi:hypothetical protein